MLPGVVVRGDPRQDKDARADNRPDAEQDQVDCAQAFAQPLPLPLGLGRELLRLQRAAPHCRLRAAGREGAW